MFNRSILIVVENFQNWTQQFMEDHRVLIHFIRENHADSLEFRNMNDFVIYRILGDEVEKLNPGNFFRPFLNLININLKVFLNFQS